MELSTIEQNPLAMHKQTVLVPSYLTLHIQLCTHSFLEQWVDLTISCSGALLYGLIISFIFCLLTARASALMARAATRAAFNTFAPNMILDGKDFPRLDSENKERDINRAVSHVYVSWFNCTKKITPLYPSQNLVQARPSSSLPNPTSSKRSFLRVQCMKPSPPPLSPDLSNRGACPAQTNTQSGLP